MKKKTLLCPNCNSDDNVPNWDNAWAVDTGNFQNYRKCNNCGYVGQLFTEPSSDEPYEEVHDKIPRKFWDKQFEGAYGYIKILLAILFVLLLLRLLYVL